MALDWSQIGSNIVGLSLSEDFGFSNAISTDGSIVAISARGVNSGRGAVRVYVYNGTSWVQRGADITPTVSFPPQDTFYSFGESISLSSDGLRIAIGAPSIDTFMNDMPRLSAGKVFVYDWNGTSWVQQGNDIDGYNPGVSASVGDNLGSSVSLSANGLTLAVGARNSTNTQGVIRMYTLNNGSWVQKGSTLYGNVSAAYFGSSVSLSADGDIVAAGASGTGFARVYIWDGADWVQRGININGLGTSVSLSSNGSLLAIGGPNVASVGQVRVYAWDGSTWTQRGANINGSVAGDSFGNRVSLSSDGSILVSGSYGYDLSGASNSGAVRMFKWDTTTSSWVQLGSTLFGTATTGSNFGRSVAIAGNGLRSIASTTSSSNTGYARVYEYPTTPGAPTSVSVVAGNTQATVSWTAPASNGGSAVTGYTVTASPAGGIVEISGNTAIVTGLTNGTAYTFTVKATNAVGDGAASTTSAAVTPTVPGGGATVPCFFGNARVLTPSGYKRMDSLKAGDKVVTPAGSEVAIERMKVIQCAAGPNTNPYVIPAGTFGASHRLLISPDHRVCLSDGRKVEAKRLGLEQEDREGTLTYYNIELAGQADMIVGGVAVESLAPVRRVVMSMADFEAAIKTRYGGLSASVLANIKRTCRLVGSNAIEVPVLRR